MLKSCVYNASDDVDISKVFETQDVYHLSRYFNYMVINHLEYWNVDSLLITSFPNNVNKIQKEGVENAFIQSACLYERRKHSGDTKSMVPALRKFKLS